MLTLASVAALAIFKASDPDLGFHLATGRAILQTGALPMTNVLSFAEPAHEWVLQQGWPALLFERLWHWGGIDAVIMCKAAVVVATWSLVLATARRLGATPPIACATTVFAAWSCAFRFVERPLIFSNLALAAVVFFLSRAWSRPARWLPSMIAVVVVTAAACHVHAGAVFSFVLLVTAAGGLLAAGAIHGALPSGEPAGLRPAAIPLVAAVAALVLAGFTLALYHPFGLRVLEVPFQMGTDHFLAQHLIEFRPPWATPFRIVAAYWAFLALTTALLIARRIPTGWALPVLAFAVLSLRHVRIVDCFAIVACGPVAAAIAAVMQARRSLAWRRLWAWPVSIALAIAGPVEQSSRVPLGLGYNLAVWPLPLFEIVRREQLRGPAFVSDGWAGPWLAFFYPAERVFFFPSFEAFSTRFVREEYFDVRYGKPGWDTTLDRHGVELVLLKYTSPREQEFQGGSDNLRQRLARDPRWTLVAFDDMGAIFVRSTGVNAAQARARGIPGVDPDRLLFLGPPDLSRAGLEAAWRRGEHSTRLAALLAAARRAQSGP